jgi:hypothetical protein
LTTLKIAVDAPMPKATVMMTVIENNGDFRSNRTA